MFFLCSSYDRPVSADWSFISVLYSDSLFPALTHSAFLHPAEYNGTAARVFGLSLKRNMRQTLCQYV